jgi:mycofactocin precursor
MADSATELLDPPATVLTDPPATVLTEPTPAVLTDPNADGTVLAPADVVAADLLVEEISIDGMCGVY